MVNERKVRFKEDVVIHHMIHWNFAYREARKGTWKKDAADRCRFLRRIQELELTLGPYLHGKNYENRAFGRRRQEGNLGRRGKHDGDRTLAGKLK